MMVEFFAPDDHDGLLAALEQPDRATRLQLHYCAPDPQSPT